MPSKTRRIELIARGVLIHADQVLLARNLRQGHLFLPGGHVEFGETAKATLEREMREELGVSLVAGAFLGGMEAAFEQPGRKSGKPKPHHEVNLVFALDPPDPKSFDPATLRSAEPALDFVWRALNLVLAPDADQAVLPAGIERLVARHPAAPVDSTDAGAWQSCWDMPR